MHITKWRKPICQGYIWCDCNYTILWKRENLKRIKRLAVARVQRAVRMESGAQWIFRGVTLFCVILLWGIHVIIHLSKPIECTTPRVNPCVNYGLSVVMTCQCSFSDCNKRTTLVLDIDSGGLGCVYLGAESNGNSLYFLLSFAVNLKLLKKLSLF